MLQMLEVKANTIRQYIDARATFEALEDAIRNAAQIRGGMYWHKGPPNHPENTYLVRTSPTGAEKSMGPRSPETEAIFASFEARKIDLKEHIAGLKTKMNEHKRMNKALRVGRIDPLVIDILAELANSGLTTYFRVVGTHAIYAYETEAGVLVDSDTVATRDIDLLWDVRKRLHFAEALKQENTSMLGVLKKVDKTFRLKTLQKYTATNNDGFEVDILRRMREPDDPHPIRMSDDEDDFWVTEALNANQLLDSPSFSSVIVSTNGNMARMNTLHPLSFTKFKRWMSQLPSRNPLKKRRDAMQADIIEKMVHNYLPHLVGNTI